MNLTDLAHPGTAPETDFLVQPQTSLVVGQTIPAASRPRERALENVLEIVDGKGFLEEIVGAERGDLESALALVRVCHDHDRARRAALRAETTQQLAGSGAEVEDTQR